MSDSCSYQGTSHNLILYHIYGVNTLTHYVIVIAAHSTVSEQKAIDAGASPNSIDPLTMDENTLNSAGSIVSVARPFLG